MQCTCCIQESSPGQLAAAAWTSKRYKCLLLTLLAFTPALAFTPPPVAAAAAAAAALAAFDPGPAGCTVTANSAASSSVPVSVLPGLRAGKASDAAALRCALSSMALYVAR